MSGGNETVIGAFTKLVACYNLLLTLASFVLNPFVCFICLKSSRLRASSTFKLLAFNSINSALTTIGCSEDTFTYAFFNVVPYNQSLAYCRWFVVFIGFSTLELQSWMLVSVSLDRLMFMHVAGWSRTHFGGLRPFLYAASLTIFIGAANIVSVFNVGVDTQYPNGTEVIDCFTTSPDSAIDWLGILKQVYVYFGFIVPIIILIVSNSVIIYMATRFTRAQKVKATASKATTAKQRTQVTRMILFITFLYIATSTQGIVVVYLYQQIYELSSGIIILSLLNSILFSFPAFSFFILFFSNKHFANEVRKVLSKFKRNRVSNHS